MLATPDPRVPVPQGGKQMNGTGLRPSVTNGDLYQDVVRRVFGILGEHIPVSALVKNPRVL